MMYIMLLSLVFDEQQHHYCCRFWISSLPCNGNSIEHGFFSELDHQAHLLGQAGGEYLINLSLLRAMIRQSTVTKSINEAL